jgi:uncharacterized protein DUF6941
MHIPIWLLHLCANAVLEEKDQVLSIIRVVDIFYVQSFPRDLPKETQAAVPFVAVLCFKKSFAETSPVKHTVSLVLHGPSRTPIKTGEQTEEALVASFVFEAEKTAANIVVNTLLPTDKIEFGTYWYQVTVDGEQVTRIPFKVLERPVVQEAQPLKH